MNNITDWIMVIITFVYAVVTIGIFWANKKAADVAKSQLEGQIKSAEEERNYYQQSLNQQKEDSRISRMPFFFLSKDISFGIREDCLVLCLKLTNCGNGSAIQIGLVSTDSAQSEKSPAVYANAVLNFIYIQSDELSRNFAKSDETIKLELLRELPIAEKHLSEDRVTIQISFQDILGNKYVQKIWFEYHVSDFYNGIGKIGFYQCDPPTLVNEKSI